MQQKIWHENQYKCRISTVFFRCLLQLFIAIVILSLSTWCSAIFCNFLAEDKKKSTSVLRYEFTIFYKALVLWLFFVSFMKLFMKYSAKTQKKQRKYVQAVQKSIVSKYWYWHVYLERILEMLISLALFGVFFSCVYFVLYRMCDAFLLFYVFVVKGDAHLNFVS